MNSYRTTTIGSLVKEGALEFGDGYRTKRPELGTPGLPILRVAEVFDGKISPSFTDHVHESYAQKMGRKISQSQDIILTTKGTVGRTAIIPNDSPKFVYSPQVCYFRITDKKSLDHKYLYYWFKSDQFCSQASSLMSQTDMAAYLNLADIRSLLIKVPDIKSQRKTSEVLGALDDKIAVNERISLTAGELATAAYASAKQASPENFADTPLSSTADFINGKAFTKDATGTGRMVVRIAEMNSGPGTSTVYNDIEVPEKHLANPGDILFSWSGSLVAQRWYRTQAIINQHIFKVVPKNQNPPWLIFELVKHKITDFRAIAANKATTMGHIQRRHLDELVPVPDAEVISRLDSSLGPLWNRALAAEREKLMLAELRDTLLPQLMSGKLRVKDAERIVEDNV
ncbi:restriction endonuclease subunit S [Nocardiopsis sp. CC223A]|uniref:restriction endonuclease subunit S n=1 Tax=Nocardiopsis sp. CC223A TaxID=3044051 RepID=UPI00278C739E|nr:restriction endonuclease subunit S [Nocardiopsis sp. CC223A]